MCRGLILTRRAPNVQNEIAVLKASKTKQKYFPSRSTEKLISNSFTVQTTLGLSLSTNNNYLKQYHSE
jgi:hypothetical protein